MAKLNETRYGRMLYIPTALRTNLTILAAARPAPQPPKMMPVVSHGFVGSNTLNPNPLAMPPSNLVPAQTRSQVCHVQTRSANSSQMAGGSVYAWDKKGMEGMLSVVKIGDGVGTVEGGV
jgi:hypothetical protein